MITRAGGFEAGFGLSLRTQPEQGLRAVGRGEHAVLDVHAHQPGVVSQQAEHEPRTAIVQLGHLTTRCGSCIHPLNFRGFHIDVIIRPQTEITVSKR